MKYWTPWIDETKQLILKTARWVFAALILLFLILACIAAVMVILVKLAQFQQLLVCQ